MVVRTTFPLPTEQTWSPPAQGQWTYADYKHLPDDGWRYEVIEGELKTSPAPKIKHQRVSINLAMALATFVRQHNLGEVLTAPIDVRMGQWADPVQPDILFIQREHLDIVKENWIEGAPDLIVEILSSSSWLDDRRTKYRIYAQAGVREYWLVDPDECQIEIFVLRGGDYALVGRFASGELAPSEILKGLQIQVDEICQ